MAQNQPLDVGAQRVPMMSAATLDAKTRPAGSEPTPIWLRHRLQRRHMRESTPPPRRAREWFNRLARRGADV